MQNHERNVELTRTTLGLLFLLGLIGGALWILRPFLSAILWSGMIVTTTWPALQKLQSLMWGRRSLAAVAMTLAILLVLIVPLGFAVGALVSHIAEIRGLAKSLEDFALPAAPDWLSHVPLIGNKLTAAWQDLTLAGTNGLRARMQPYAGHLLEWFARQVGGVGAMLLQFLLTVVISAILYMHGESVGRGLTRFARRVAGESGVRAVHSAAGSVRAVAMGVVGTAAAQSVVAGAGLLFASVPGALLLTSAVLVLCLAQLGPMLVMIPAVVWKFYSGDSLWGGILLAFALVSGIMDNVLRPILIKLGADLPLLLILAGVIGGMITFGIMGIFMGPVILAVCYTLLCEWVEGERGANGEAPPVLSEVRERSN